ncbi:hypothetical protein BDZ85DRAFT_277269 [Elsinoe ampelina]|uniref:Uncharacterized protein n=1 Tax=Elsinoe ampelina TaxID=302913 RepID=A0A6A6GP57_9PEZI|nr:hypothetical protein BDZ85DRAFT_277269 [Elsinoe ampelina]
MRTTHHFKPEWPRQTTTNGAIGSRPIETTVEEKSEQRSAPSKPEKIKYGEDAASCATPLAPRNGDNSSANDSAVFVDNQDETLLETEETEVRVNYRDFRPFLVFDDESGLTRLGVHEMTKGANRRLNGTYGVRVLDIQQTLPNLTYALAYMGAGEGQLPARKACGVRGLVRGNGGAGSAMGSMQNSFDGGITMRREWAVSAEEKGLDRRESFKSGWTRSVMETSPLRNIASVNWEGILRGDVSSTRKAAGLGVRRDERGSVAASAKDTLVSENESE